MSNICLVENANGEISRLATDLREIGIGFEVCSESDGFSELCDAVEIDAVLIDVGSVTRQCTMRVLDKARQRKKPSLL